MNAGWDRPFGNSGDSIRFHGNSVERDNEAQKRDGVGVKLTFREFAGQTIISETGENFLHVVDMFFHYIRVNKDIIHKDNAKII